MGAGSSQDNPYGYSDIEPVLNGKPKGSVNNTKAKEHNAQDLLITWAENERNWRWLPMKDLSSETLEVAELLTVAWLEVHGRFEVAKLSPGTVYEVVFVVKLKAIAYGWEVPVNVRIILPDGRRQEHKENLMEKPKEQWIEIKAGEFKASADKEGEMEVSLFEYEGGTWKRGLLIMGVIIRPKHF